MPDKFLVHYLGKICTGPAIYTTVIHNGYIVLFIVEKYRQRNGKCHSIPQASRCETKLVISLMLPPLHSLQQQLAPVKYVSF